ncbi:MAG TPA: heat-inducible transcriptional repressor HrcA [Actinomycetota bacterium]|nr:heat-inducible transcriptional repressor HrcA [Actinomycetota bacterium]
MTEPAELGPRKAAILRAVVEEYVRSGEPVGSETIAEGSNLGVSSATIRNEMAALEELGYLSHPHTSAGRVPTDLGYRCYVDTLPQGLRLRDAQRRAISGFFAETMLDLEEVLRGTTQLLSRLTQYAGVAVPPRLTDETVVRVEVIDLGPTLLVLVVGQHGAVEKQAIDRPADLTGETLEGVGRRLDTLRGLTLPEAQARALRLAGETPGTEREVLIAVAEALGDMQAMPRGTHVLIGGVSNLASEAAHWRRETMRHMIEALERESEMLMLLQDVSGPQEDMSVTIGTEHPSTGEWDASVVAAPFRSGDQALGTIGVVGPTRMDYVSVMASVRAVAKRLSELATELGA